MNGIMRQTMMNGYVTYEQSRGEQETVERRAAMEPESKCSIFSMVAMGGALLMCAGIILYALLTI